MFLCVRIGHKDASWKSRLVVDYRCRPLRLEVQSGDHNDMARISGSVSRYHRKAGRIVFIDAHWPSCRQESPPAVAFSMGSLDDQAVVHNHAVHYTAVSIPSTGPSSIPFTRQSPRRGRRNSIPRLPPCGCPPDYPQGISRVARATEALSKPCAASHWPVPAGAHVNALAGKRIEVGVLASSTSVHAGDYLQCWMMTGAGGDHALVLEKFGSRFEENLHLRLAWEACVGGRPVVQHGFGWGTDGRVNRWWSGGSCLPPRPVCA